MAERLCLGTEVKELKLGSTFTTNNRKAAYHTVKYDFKPASVDVSKMATVEVGSNNTMTVTVPHLDGAGIPHTVFKGSQRPYSKECVLIIDHVTGEITLERLSSNIQVKKTRVEQKNHSSTNHSNSTSSSISNNTLNSLSAISNEQKRNSPTHGRTSSRTKVTSGKKREPTVQLHSIPKNQQQSPRRVSPYHNKSPSGIINNNCSPRQSANSGSSSLASLPMIGGDFDDFLPTSGSLTPSSIPSINLPTQTIVNNNNSNNNNNNNNNSKIGDLSDSSSNSSGSESSDSEDSEEENISNPAITNESTNGNIQSSTLNNNLLNQDLQLSESESD